MEITDRHSYKRSEHYTDEKSNTFMSKLNCWTYTTKSKSYKKF